MNKFLALASIVLAGCGAGDVSSDREAELAYLGLDGAVDRALRLGLDGFNEASSANIDAQSEPGDLAGTMTITGQADQGSSANKGLRLEMLLEGYTDLADIDDDENAEVLITYDTDPAALPAIDLQLKDMPDGTLDGTLIGDFLMTTDLEGVATFDLTIAGTTEEDPANAGYVRRVDGATTVTGTVTNDAGGRYAVDVTL